MGLLKKSFVVTMVLTMIIGMTAIIGTTPAFAADSKRNVKNEKMNMNSSNLNTNVSNSSNQKDITPLLVVTVIGMSCASISILVCKKVEMKRELNRIKI